MIWNRLVGIHFWAAWFFLFFAFAKGLAQTSDSAMAAKQAKKEVRKNMMHDTLDGRLDFSSLFIDAKGFVPLPFIVTEPALGGFGAAVAPMFLTPKKLPGYKGYIPPDITAGFGMYTVNGSWAAGALRIGSIPKAGIKYRAGFAAIDLNLTFYRDIPQEGEKEFEFTISSLPITGSISKRITKKDLYLGVQYTYAKTKAKPRFEGDIPDFISEEELDNVVAVFGTFLDWDKRNSVFTPDKGGRLHVQYNMSDAWTGSNFSFSQLSGSMNWFVPFQKNWISGLRFEAFQVFGEPPFYALPSLNMRGVPNIRFQGYTTMVLETEQRWDLNKRWSMVGFAGLGKALQKTQSFGEATTAWNLGTGFRYLMARAFNLRGGVDIAKGPGSWGWYIVFGHNWNR